MTSRASFDVSDSPSPPSNRTPSLHLGIPELGSATVPSDRATSSPELEKWRQDAISMVANAKFPNSSLRCYDDGKTVVECNRAMLEDLLNKVTAETLKDLEFARDFLIFATKLATAERDIEHSDMLVENEDGDDDDNVHDDEEGDVDDDKIIEEEEDPTCPARPNFPWWAPFSVVDLTGASESPEPTEQDVRNAEEASRAIEESITKILGAAHVTGGSDMASPRWHTNSYHIDCLLKLSSVIELHHLPAESPTQLARAFYAFSQLSMNEISDEKINWLRDLVRHGPYSRETEAKPGEFFANAAACEKVACQFSDLHVQFKMIIWCQSCQQRVPQEHVSRTAIIEMIDPEDMDGPDPSGDIRTNISRSFGQRDQQTKTPCQSALPTYISVGDTDRAVLLLHFMKREHFEFDIFDENLKRTRCPLAFKAAVTRSGGHFVLYWTPDGKRHWMYNDIGGEGGKIIEPTREGKNRAENLLPTGVGNGKGSLGSFFALG
ncbi:hypothetical protein IWX90DRAFT_483166 [Phyllosticta citrichinensis]|uniref:Uncharacterized protein n=1 Tax=Phyllosticta citrichinensis TaxID=1130410 RepID=A0ABR1Y1V2_9PEZI